MTDRILKGIKDVVNKSIAPIGVQLVRSDDHDWSNVATFIPFEATLKGAREAGLSVGDYIDSVLNGIPGSSQATIDQLVALGAVSRRTACIVEIGPGSGRYLEKTLKACSPARYEVYETAASWASYVGANFNVVVQPTDGRSLKATRSQSADLVHAHKVFSTVSFLTTCRYWVEMIRVTKPGGYVVFDIVTEACFGPDTLEAWANSGIENGSFPALMPREVALGYFADRGFQLVGSFMVALPPGKTEAFVFRRSGSPSDNATGRSS